jgi:molybdenum cofactor biosynthesis enzyme MoaA
LPPPDAIQRSSISSGSALEYNADIVPALLEELQQSYTSIESLIIAGEGEPTLRLTELLELVQKFRTTRNNKNGDPKTTMIRLTTNGLIDDNDNNTIAQVVESLHDAGVSHVSVALMTADADQYNRELMQPVMGSHDNVCKFIQEAIRVGLQVETTAVDRPDVDKEATEALARELKVTTPVRWRPYFGWTKQDVCIIITKIGAIKKKMRLGVIDFL